MGFEPNELDVTGGASAPSSWSSGNDGDTTYTGTINTSGVSSSDNDATVTISVDSNRAEDAVGNGNSASSSSVDETVTVDKKKPTPTIAAVSGTKSGEFPITINFDEDVRNFDSISDISVSTQSGNATGAASNITTVNAGEYTATITPSGMGTLRILVSAGAAEDDAGNASVASMNVDVSVDTSGPTPTITAPMTTQNGNFAVTIDFDEDVSGFTPSGVTVTNANKASNWKSSTTTTYLLSLVPTTAEGSTGIVTIDVAAGVATDAANNDNEAASRVTVNIDKDAPTLTITAPSDPQNGNTFDVTFTFDEDVIDFEPSDVTVTNADKASSWQSDTATTYVLRLTPDATAGEEETVTIDVAAGGATDAANNGNEAATQASVMVDKIRPTVLISGLPSGEENDAFDLTITFNENVSGFAKEDLTVTGQATATAVSGSGSNYTATITPNANKEGNVTVRVKANAARDEAGNGNTLSTATSAIRIDTVRPTVVIEDVPDEAQSKEFDLIVRFNEAVNGFDENDVSLTGPATVDGVVPSGNIGGYYVIILPNDAVDGEVTVKINADVVPDEAGNTNTASTTVRFRVDTVAPTAAFSGVPNAPQKDPFTVTLTFSEPVYDFEIPDDLKVRLNTMTVALHPDADDAAVYELRVTPRSSIDGSTPESIIIKSSAVEDNAGNLNEDDFDSGEIVIDTIVPTVESITGVPPMEQKGAFDLTVTFSEPVRGFAVPGDLTVVLMDEPGVTSASPIATVALKSAVDGDAVYMVTVTPNAAGAEGDVTVTVNANTVQDFALNDNTASAVTPAMHIDTIVPTVEITGEPDKFDEQNAAFDLMVTFSEPVTGFSVPADLTLTGPATAALTASDPDGAVYTVTITPNATSKGDVTVQVNAGGVEDEAHNDNTASNTPLVHVDTMPPTVAIEGVPTIEKNGAYDLTIRFSEPVTGFSVPAHLTVGLVAEPGVTSASPIATVAWKSGEDREAVYMVTVTPNAAGAEGDVTVQVNANTVQDFALNDNTASAVTPAMHIDTIVPTVEITGEPDKFDEQNAAFDLMVTFSEPVTGFSVPADLTVGLYPEFGLTSASPIATVTLKSGVEGASEYVVTVTPNAAGAEGDVTVQVNANAVQDKATNENTEASKEPEFLHVDTIVPTVEITRAPDREKNEPFGLTVTFSELVTGFAVSDDLTLTGPATAALTSGSDGDDVYVVTITPNATSEGDVTVQVNAGGVEDEAHNDNTASNTPSVHVDTMPPTVAIEGVPTMEQNEAYDLTIRFSEEVNGFSLDDLTVTLAPEAGVTSAPGDIAAVALKSGVPGSAVYVVTVTPNAAGAEGDVTVQVKANTVRDFAMNANPAGSNAATVHIDTIAPTVAISGEPETEQNAAFDLTVTFSEPVFDFEDGYGNDVRWVGFMPDSSAVLFQFEIQGADGDSVYTVRVTPMSGIEGSPVFAIIVGPVDSSLPTDGVSDAAGNIGIGYVISDRVHVDTIVPTATISGLPTGEENDAFPLTITFLEDVTGFAAAGLEVTGESTATTVSGGPKVYTATITPNDNKEGDVTVQVKANAVTDDAGNSNTVSAATPAIHIDTIVPTVSVSGFPDIEKNVAYDLTVTFSEPVKGFSVTDDLAVTLAPEPGVTSATPIAAAALTEGEDGEAVYTVTITPNAAGAEGDVTVTVNAAGVQDFALNDNTASPEMDVVHVDTIVPTVSVSGFPTIEKNVPYDLTVTFSEPVTGFAVPGGLTLGLVAEPDVTSATPIVTAALTASDPGGAVYTVTITPNAAGAEGDVTVTVNADTVQDLALNANPAASPETTSVHVDTIVPTVSVSGFPPATPEQNGAFTLTVTFSEEVNGFAVPADLTVTGPATAALASGADGADVYTVTITPDATFEGDVTVTVNATTVQDLALNDNTASTETTSVHVDTIPPTVSLVVTPPVTIGQETGYPTQERNAPYTLTVTFSEPVNGFAVSGDLTITGPGTAALTSGSAGDSVYVVRITPNATSEGDVRVTVNATTVADFATNANPAGSSAVPVHIDTRPPTFTIEDTPVLQRRNDFFDIRVVFLEPVNDFEVEDFTFTPSDLVTPSLVSGAGGASEYIVRMTPNEDVQGELIIEINEESVQDFALNLNVNSVATQQPVRIDTIAPTVEITDLPTGVKNEAFDVTITFAEVVNGFTTEDIVLVGPATVALIAGTDGDAIYTARVTPNPNAMGNVTLQIPAAVVLDLAENANVASLLTPAIASDTNALTVELQKVPDTVQLEAFSVMIVFSNDVEGFVLADIEIEGDAVILSSTLLGTGSTYTLNITPDENTDGDVIINVPAGVAQDAGGKSNAASVPQTIAVAPKWIPDTSLRDAFREQLNLGAGTDFTQQQVRAITTIEAEMSGMSNLTGLEQAMALTTLVLPGNEITSITPLKQLTKLTSLNLAGNAITDITPLSGLTALTTLNLGGNSLTDISAIKDLTNLTALDLSNNALTDISLLDNFTQLTTLNLAGNRITDISALTVLTKLTTLNLNDNPIGDFTPLTGLTALTTLELGGTGLSSLNAISGLKALTALNLSDNSLTDIALLADLTALTALNLSENTISSLTVLSGLTGLTLLNLNDNAIIDITPLSSLTRLTTLELADNAITSLTSLTVLTLLTRLDLSDNAITEVAPIVGLANLQTLLLIGNPILNTAPLYPLTQRVRPVDIDIAVSQYPPWDVNEDGTVDALDSALVAAALGQSGDAIIDPRTDVNGDGTVDNADLTLVTTNLEGGVGGAPSIGDTLSLLDPATLRTLDRATLETYLNSLRLESDGSLKYRNAIALLESLLAALRPTQTRLLANYPNPFNPETWLPYELAVDSTVELFIYDARGVLVRHLELGHQPAGYYIAKSRAVYWDGRNSVGERVSSGIYFYQLRAGSISQLRKMVILK